ncbi:MAG: type II secretion system F family protein [Desulfovibrionaceae bacterium]
MGMQLLITLVAVAAAFLLVMAAQSLVFARRDAGRRQARERLRIMAARNAADAGVSIRRDRDQRTDWLARLARRLSPAGGVEEMLRQARWSMPPSVFMLLCAVLAVLAFVAVDAATGSLLFGLGAAGAAGYAPVVLARAAKARRMAAFQRQLPDALDLVGRALKAGHAFNSGLRMVADEFGDPIGPEFGTTLDEINFGLGTGEAMDNLLARVDCPDLMFFVASVNIQRETGGNLSEIVESIANLVRERFKLQGRVQVLAAEGKLTAMVLLVLPFLAAGAIFVLNPHYLGMLFSHPLGRMMLGAAGGMMLVGIVVIRRMVVIKV